MTFEKTISCTAAAVLLSLVTSAPAAAQQQPTLSASVNGTQVAVQWTNVPGATAYEVVVTGTASGTVTVPATQTVHVLNASPGVYSLSVRGRAGGVVGPFSNVVTINVGGGGSCTQIGSPNLTASVQGTVVTLTWGAVPGAIGYRIDVGRSPGGTEASQLLGPGTTSFTVNVGAVGTYYARVVTANGCSTNSSNEVTVNLGGAPPPPPGPTPPGPGNRTPDPPPGAILPLPGYGPAVVQSIAAQFPGALRNSCGNHEWLFRVVRALRQLDSRWGLNWKRGRVGDLSEDVVTYNFGAGPDEGTTNVYIIDIIFGHCGGNPGPTWIDQTGATRAAGTIGRWTLQPLGGLGDASQ